MLKYLIFIAILLVSCQDNKLNKQKSTLHVNDTSMIKTHQIEGLWLESKNKYESSFILILNDTIYKLRGAALKYYFHHDTMLLTATPRDNKKIKKVSRTELILINSSHDTIRLRRAI